MIPSNLRMALEADQELRKSLPAGNTFNSDVILDMVFWNVVIAFVVNITASAVYDKARKQFMNDEGLTAKDLAKLADLLKQPIDGYDPARVDMAVRAAAQILEDQGVSDAEAAVRRAVQTAASPNGSDDRI